MKGCSPNHWTSKEFPVLHFFLWLNNIPFRDHVTFYLIHSSFGFFPPLGSWKLRCCEYHIQGFVWTHIFSSLGYIPRSGMTGLYDKSIINFLKNRQTIFWSSCTILHSRQQCMRAPISSHPCQHPSFCVFVSHPSGCEIVSVVVFFFSCCTSLMTSDSECLFMCFWLFVYLLWRNVYPFAHLKNRTIGLLWRLSGKESAC